MTDWYRACDLAELIEGEPLAVDIQGVPVSLYRIAERCYATHNVCTHAYALLSDGFLEGEVVECPLHAARFSVVTGECLSGPAPEGISTYEVKVESGGVFVRIPRAASKPSSSTE